MTVALVIAMFVTLIAVDYLVSRSRKPATETERVAPPRLTPSIVGGFNLASNVRYHQGHTWALAESPQLVRVGIDDFAARVIGKVDKLALPLAGTWVRQGQPVLSLERNGHTAKLVSPIEGTVVEINPALANDPDLAHRDPYGDGWVMTVHAPDAKTSFRNLFGGTLARRWMEDTAKRLQSMMAPSVAGALAQDGGLAVDDLTPHLVASWDEVNHEFFLG